METNITKAHTAFAEELRNADVVSKRDSESIDFVICSLGAGGAERVVTLLANALADDHWKVRILILNSPETIYEISPHVKVLARLDAQAASSRSSVLWRPLGVFRKLAWIRRTILSHKPQIVVSFLTETNVLAYLGLALSGTTLIVSERTSPTAPHLQLHWEILRRMCYPFCSTLVVQTQGSADIYRKRGVKKTVVIPNPVIEPPPRQRTSSQKTIVSVGRLIPAKGHDLLIKAMAICPIRQDWRLQIVGAGPLLSELQALAVAMNVDVEFVGQSSNVYQYLADADIFVLSSRYEGFPNALCEAMSMGLPVISFDCPFGPGDIVSHARNGLLVPPQDVPGLAQAMTQLMTDAEQRRRLGAEAKQLLTRFGLATVKQKWLDCIARCAPHP